jgi:hypothetical protein
MGFPQRVAPLAALTSLLERECRPHENRLRFLLDAPNYYRAPGRKKEDAAGISKRAFLMGSGAYLAASLNLDNPGRAGYPNSKDCMLYSSGG